MMFMRQLRRLKMMNTLNNLFKKSHSAYHNIVNIFQMVFEPT